MNILLLNYEYPPLGGGAGKATQNIARHLAKLQNNVHVITSNSKFSFNKTFENEVSVYYVPSIRKGIHDCGLRGALTYLFFAYITLLYLARQNKYDIVHYFFSLPTAFLSILPGRHKKLPYIVSLRGSDVPNYDLYHKKLEFLHKLYLPLTKHIWKKANKVVAVTPSLRLTALRTNPKQSIEIIPNGIDTTIFSPSTNRKNDDNNFRLITVSRLIKRKGIQYILKALSEIKDDSISLTIIGEGNYEKELKKMNDDLGLSKTVVFLGYCKRESIPIYLQRSDVFILLSLAEAFGNVIAEAMACSLPIISSNEGGIPDLVTSENGILVQPEDILQIKSAIILMKNNKEMRRSIGKANTEKITTFYNWESVASAYKNIYLESLDGHYK
jgi:glycosyltransferase involved in cell wall biosynthesis